MLPLLVRAVLDRLEQALAARQVHLRLAMVSSLDLVSGAGTQHPEDEVEMKPRTRAKSIPASAKPKDFDQPQRDDATTVKPTDSEHTDLQGDRTAPYAGTFQKVSWSRM
jgi:hypothetical protein